MDNKCPKTEKCPLFQGEILVSPHAYEIYSVLYCNNGPEGRNSLKRFLLGDLIKGVL